MTEAVVIVFLLNGMQVQLPAPAQLIDNVAYVPARAVFEDLGWKVEWFEQRRQMWVGRGLAASLFTVDSPVVTEGRAPDPQIINEPPWTIQAAPRMVGDCFYMPVRAVAQMTGGRVEWEEKTLTVNLIADDPVGGTPTEIGAIVADPPKWAGKLVRLRGEYTGWEADPFGPATMHGPPAGRSDWTLRDATGSLYCTPRYMTSVGPPIDYNVLGQRLEVKGTVALTKDGWPYLLEEETNLLTGLDGLTCYLTTDRNSYKPGDTIRMQMQVRNPTAEALVLNFNTSQQYDFTVSDAEGKTVWKWSQGRMFAQMLTQKTLQPGDAYTVTAEWALPATLAPAQYKVSGLLNRDVHAYVKPVAVGKE